MSFEDDINAGAITNRLRTLSEAMPLAVLIVDDDELERALIGDRLAQRGIRVAEAANGVEALERLRKEEIPVVIVDWHMPVMDGIEFTERFRAEIPGDTYVIMLTSRRADFDFERGYSAGVDDYLTKGVREPELIARIHAGLHTHSLRVQLRQARAALARTARAQS
ncbi:MAG: response regulator [Steroidobacteraceae bacterium]|nr:response regulator [Steroidobacteraceae bacterium]